MMEQGLSTWVWMEWISSTWRNSAKSGTICLATCPVILTHSLQGVSTKLYDNRIKFRHSGKGWRIGRRAQSGLRNSLSWLRVRNRTTHRRSSKLLARVQVNYSSPSTIRRRHKKSWGLHRHTHRSTTGLLVWTPKRDWQQINRESPLLESGFHPVR